MNTNYLKLLTLLLFILISGIHVKGEKKNMGLIEYVTKNVGKITRPKAVEKSTILIITENSTKSEALTKGNQCIPIFRPYKE